MHEIILLLASPLFDLLFARDRSADIVVNESIHFVAFTKLRAEVLP